MSLKKFSRDLDAFFSFKATPVRSTGARRGTLFLFSAGVVVLCLGAILFFTGGTSAGDSALIPACSIFSNEGEYLSHIRENVEFEGMRLDIITMRRGDNFWKVARKYGVDIDTLIGANPWWGNLLAHVEQEIVVPSRKGALHFVAGLDELDRLAADHKTSREDILVQRLPFFRKHFPRLFDDGKPIAVFLKDARPTAAHMTAELARQFTVREMFRSPLGGRFSSFFGNRVHPIFHRWKFHDGLDIAARYGTPVGAPCEGRVIAAGWMGGYGKAVVISHPKGYKTLCGHLSRINVREGQYVPAGKIIGRVGSTGFSTGPHLHFSLWKDGRPIDPMKVLW